MKHPDLARSVAPELKFGYLIDRREFDGTNQAIETLHGTSFITKVIPELLQRKADGEPVTVLDCGSGIAVYPDQLRQAFGNKIKVSSTGNLDRQQVEDARKANGLNPLHHDDLKLKSIDDLQADLKFDLILDTRGEQFYKTNQDTHSLEKARFENWKNHVRTLLSRRSDIGVISLSPVNAFYDVLQPFLNEIRAMGLVVNADPDDDDKINFLRITTKELSPLV